MTFKVEDFSEIIITIALERKCFDLEMQLFDLPCFHLLLYDHIT